MRKKLPVIILLLAVAGAAVYVSRTSRSTGPGFPTVYGNVDIREVRLGFRVSGRIRAVLRQEGDAVAEGDELAKLDEGPYQREAAQAEAQVQALKARLQLLEAGPRPQELAQARAAVKEREATLANAGLSFKRQQELYGTRAVSQQERDDAEARYTEAEARLVLAKEQLGLLEAGFRAEEIAQARAELKRAEAALASAQIRVADTVLRAPESGVVLSRVEEAGSIVQPGQPVLTLSLRDPVWVRAYVSEKDLGRVKPGMKAEVRTDSRPGQPYSGQVGYISPRAEFTPKNVETADLRTSLVYRLRVVVTNADEGLRQGMPVTVLLDAASQQ